MRKTSPRFRVGQRMSFSDLLDVAFQAPVSSRLAWRAPGSPVAEARQDDTSQVSEHQNEQGMRDQIVRSRHPLNTPELVRRGHPAREGGRGHSEEQREDHRPTGGVVTDVASLSPGQDISEIAQHGSRRTRELREARIVRADDAPDDPQQRPAQRRRSQPDGGYPRSRGGSARRRRSSPPSSSGTA